MGAAASKRTSTTVLMGAKNDVAASKRTSTTVHMSDKNDITTLKIKVQD